MTAGRRARALGRAFYARDALEVAPQLLNKVLVAGTGPDRRAGRIIEVEAYRGAEDPASHAYRGMTRRNATMFGRPGLLYVYFTYGMHWCANVVCMPDGVASAVLLRAAAPLSGLEAMFRARGGHAARERDLASGPAKLCQAFGITGAADGADLVKGNRAIRILDDGVAPPRKAVVSGRIGVHEESPAPWRFHVPGCEHVSR